MNADELSAVLESGGAQYAAHTFDFAIDVGTILQSLSAPARRFYHDANDDKGELQDASQLYFPRWSEDPDLLKKFDRLTDEERLEVLCLYTAPIHEFRHHADMVLAPFGAGFYVSLAQEYLDFQQFSPFLLQNQDLVPPGPLKELESRLEALNQAIPPAWQGSWAKFKRRVFWFEACTDFRGINPVNSAVVRNPNTVVRALGLELEEVTVNGIAASFSPRERPGWYMRSATLLEGRAVIASLSWILWTLEGHPRLGETVALYVHALYPANGNYDYRFLLDLAAKWMGADSIESACREQDSGCVREILFMVDSAAWFALQAAMKNRESQVAYENLFMRFFYALQEMELAYDRGYAGSPLDLLDKIENEERARTLRFLPLQDGVASTLSFVHRARTQTLPAIWQSEVREHFGHIFDQLEKGLKIRLKQGYVTPLAASYMATALLYLDDEHRFLLQPYKAKPWVKRWFQFRNQSIFTPDTSTRKRQHLAGQFGLAELLIPCECGRMISAAVPKWRSHHREVCGHCGKAHELSAEDIRYIAAPDEPDE